ncbi:glycoside hydrolase family 97 protein [Flavobacterium azooxidireducens]|uniref:Glycoside hydrolase family 97 protein n=1 Tax=Flavobacterium azooxidireducens TaxID=1871076 RepID=A0ABY4KBV3_9FLAO|nr:glycoside hydrolase family 97 protein [Flavobacterium azooxidireducens]UPQ78249.1 glycoside hydrolase family 97 protein [Flavobacterium azooxidireducens]
MKKSIAVFCLMFVGFAHSQQLKSPDNQLEMIFELSKSGKPSYQLKYKNKSVVQSSSLGLMLKNNEDLIDGFEVINSKTTSFSDKWKPVLGEEKEIIDLHNQLVVELLQKATGRKMNLVFRLFNEGLAFRYEIPTQEKLNYFVISDETTQFLLTGDHKAFWIPGDYDSQEYSYNETKLSQIDVDKLEMNNGIGMKGPMTKSRIQSPVMMKSSDGLYLNIFEAAVVNYPVMHLDVNTKSFLMQSHLVPNAIGDKAYLQAPANTPWRTIMVSDDARTILASKMVLNLNEPSKIEDTSWIKPMKYVGIWWEMHVGKATWDYAGSQNAQMAQDAELKPTGKHGATTENTKKYIDFAAKHGFDGVLVEGWNVGWEDWFGNWKENVFDFVTSYPDFNVEEVQKYAESKGVKMIMHHETSGSVSNYERRMDRAYSFMKKHNYDAVKSGYVGKIIPRGEWHDGQAMVNHFNYAVERAAEYKIMVNSHESSRPTGYHRTYPNYIAAEAARGNEFNAWSVGNPPAHETILPFTRFLGGPMDYTPGIFEIKMSHYDATKKEQVHTTLAKQLALYVTIYSPLQMAADLPENYERYPDAFQFIKDVEVDWDKTEILEAEPGDFVTIARKTKGKESWFLGAITDENPRSSEISLSFLTPGKKYKATIYQDGKDAHWEKNPKSYSIKTIEVTAKTKLKLNLAAGGGTAISFFPL